MGQAKCRMEITNDGNTLVSGCILFPNVSLHKCATQEKHNAYSPARYKKIKLILAQTNEKCKAP